jgi:hypothetical protein
VTLSAAMLHFGAALSALLIEPNSIRTPFAPQKLDVPLFRLPQSKETAGSEIRKTRFEKSER